MTRRDSRVELQKWFLDVDELLAAQREHAISPSTVPSARTEPATWTMTLKALHRDLVGLIDLLVNSPGRWIFILDAGLPGGRYVQLLLCEDGSVVAEASSNTFLEGPERRGGRGARHHRMERAPSSRLAQLVGDAGHNPP